MAHRMRRKLALLMFLLQYRHTLAFIPGADGPVSNQEGLEGGNVTLLCDASIDTPQDELMLMVWYRNNAPIYSFDARTSMEWSSETFNDSSRVAITRDPGPSALMITGLREDDEALYHCRVDFLVAQTRNVGVRLTVIVLPSVPFFLDEMGNKVGSKVGPYHEGDTLVLSCLVIGGRPPPRITWYSGEVLVDASDGASEVPGVRENELYLPLGRESSGPLGCRASNTDLAEPVVAIVEIELYLAAQSVSITWVSGAEARALAAGRAAVARCEAAGAAPPPALAWWLDHRHLTHHSNQSWVNSTGTAVSYLELTPTARDHGATLSCIATNELLDPERASRADVITLNVTYSPIVEIVMVGNRRLNEVDELETLQLECEVNANPPVDEIKWYFNDRLQSSSAAPWSRPSPRSQSAPASRALAGRYSCGAGGVLARPLHVIVRYKPECINTGVKLTQETIHCLVDSLPAPDVYFWRITPSGLETQQLTSSSPTLTLTQISGPLSEPLHVTCTADNGVASQERPCQKTLNLNHLRPQQPQQCDLAFELGKFQMRCIPVENATHYEVSVWRMSSSNASLVQNFRSVMGGGGGRAAAQGGGGGSAGAGAGAGPGGGGGGGAGGPWLVRGAVGTLMAGDEVGASACNRYGCSRDLLLRPTETLLYSAAPPWWHLFVERDVVLSLGAVVLVAVFVMSSYLAVRLARAGRRGRERGGGVGGGGGGGREQQVLRVLQLDDAACEYLHTLEHTRHVGVACSLRSCSSGYSGGSRELDPPALDRSLKPPYYWDKEPPPDVTLTLTRESAV